VPGQIMMYFGGMEIHKLEFHATWMNLRNIILSEKLKDQNTKTRIIIIL
jgi:hypothetical protein